MSDSETEKLIDGSLDTHPNEYTVNGNPFTVDIDLGSKQTVQFHYLLINVQDIQMLTMVQMEH